MIPPQPNDPLSSGENAGGLEAADRMLDALLAEVLAGQTPPDQSDIIIRRLQQPVVLSAANTRKSSSRPSRGPNSPSTSSPSNRSTSPWKFGWVTAAGLLLCAGAAVGIRYQRDAAIALNPEALQGNQGAEESGSQVQPGQLAGSAAGDRKSDSPAPRDRLPSRPIALADASSDSELPSRGPIEMFGEPDSQPLIASAPSRKPKAQPLTLVSTSLANHLTQYWDRAGVQPTKLLSPDETAKRLADRLHVKVGPKAISDSQAMLSLLTEDQNAKSLAGPVLAAISSRPDASLTRPVDKQMIAQVAGRLREGRGFDRLIASWFIEQTKAEGEGDDNAEAEEKPEVASIGSLLSPLSQHEAVVSSASLALGSDMRCVRCHDLPTSGAGAIGSQHEYWQFAASLSPWLAGKTNAPSGWFYDTLDGRRRLAVMEGGSDWPRQIVGSRQLAEGLVGAMWQMVHGRPLTSTPYDLAGSADDSELQQLRDELTDDLVASDFNLLRTISLIMTDPIVGRSTPNAMTPKGLLTASADQWIQAVAAVESFAAAPPASMPSSRVDRMSLVLNELPNTGSVDSTSALLAQPLGSDDLGLDDLLGPKKFLPAEMPEPSPAMVAGLPVRATIVMPAWMGKLPDFDSRLEHIANLAGLSDVPEDVKTLAEQMQSAELDEALILQRIWWIIRPQD